MRHLFPEAVFEAPMQFDRMKLREAMHFVVSECPPHTLGAVKLNKALYYADMISYAVTGAALTGARYKKRPFGPTSDDIVHALSELERERVITVDRVDYFGYGRAEYVSVKDYRKERLSQTDVELLKEVIEFVRDRNTTGMIGDLSHDASWETIDYGEEIPYLSAYGLFPNPIDAETLEWAETEGRAIADMKSSRDAVGTVPYGDFRNRVLEAFGQ